MNLTIAPREKIALCGSSGSGKTSLIMAFLQMIDLAEGHIMLDGMDISLFQGEHIRSRVNVVSQEPYFIPGTIRFNLDPRDQTSNEAIEIALRKVGLWEKVLPGNGGSDDHAMILNRELISSQWSHGERQLFCLARALLKKSRILILDEATSSVDPRTEGIMQEVIETEFQDKTVISVLHRFDYIDRFDRVAIMRHGKLIECDTPQALLGRDSAFQVLYRRQK